MTKNDFQKATDRMNITNIDVEGDLESNVKKLVEAVDELSVALAECFEEEQEDAQEDVKPEAKEARAPKMDSLLAYLNELKDEEPNESNEPNERKMVYGGKMEFLGDVPEAEVVERSRAVVVFTPEDFVKGDEMNNTEIFVGHSTAMDDNEACIALLYGAVRATLQAVLGDLNNDGSDGRYIKAIPEDRVVLYLVKKLGESIDMEMKLARLAEEFKEGKEHD